MGELTVIQPGLQAQIQGVGRSGLAYFAIPLCGPLDPTSAVLALQLLENHPNSPLLECHFLPPTIRFETDAVISLTGADLKWTIDGQPVQRFRTLFVRAGSLLSGSAAEDACRAYIGIRGLIETDETFGSPACDTLAGFGGNQGRPFAVGDRIKWREASEPATSLALSIPDAGPVTSLSLLPGPEWGMLEPASIAALRTETFSVAENSNRMGARLNGPPLSLGHRSLAASVPVLPGMIQLTPSGQCIVVLQDGQTTGGYARIGYLAMPQLIKLNQQPVGRGFRFDF